MKDIILSFAAIYGVLGVVLGAFGAHAFKDKFTPDRMKSFETGVRYQLFHAIVLLVIGLQIPMKIPGASQMGWFFIIGTFLFSFSIYGLCLSATYSKKLKFLGPITPIGGLFLIAGWISLLFVGLKL